MSAASPEHGPGSPHHTELPHFLRCGYPDIGLPPAKSRPGTTRFPEARPVVEPGLHDAASMGEWVARDWAAHVDVGRIGGGLVHCHRNVSLSP